MKDQIYSILYSDVMKMLREKLPPKLFYHSPEHTIDVIQSCERIAIAEECSQEEILLLKTAALFHDSGYLRDMRDHEKHGCIIAKEMLSLHMVDPSEVDAICGIIMATKVPQTPQNKLEEIICDADLDYLGRDDYFTIAETLRLEFFAFEKVKNERDWIQLQLNFLQSHTYFTNTSVQLRQPMAEKHLRKIRETIVD